MAQPIICFEGPSGIGKTTLAATLSQEVRVVPEVNLLFERNGEESEYWYHERQVERYQMGKAAGQPAILDGDVFQPIWYNWACGYPANFLSRDKAHRFYKEQLEQGQMAFPDLYIIFSAEVGELWRRKEADTTRRRRNFEKHLGIIEPLKTYYRFLDQETDVEMHFIDYEDVESTRIAVLACIDNHTPRTLDGLETFRRIETWLGSGG